MTEYKDGESTRTKTHEQEKQDLYPHPENLRHAPFYPQVEEEGRGEEKRVGGERGEEGVWGEKWEEGEGRGELKRGVGREEEGEEGRVEEKERERGEKEE